MSTQKQNRVKNEHYRKFVDQMDKLINANARTETQAQQMTALFALEEEFKQQLANAPHKRYQLYLRFMEHIMYERGNMLFIRVYFRERQNTFSHTMFPIFKKKPFEPEQLFQFKINYWFIRWTLENYPRPTKRMREIATEVDALRHKICQENLPSVIYNAKVFWDKMDYSHLEYMDFVQNSAEGFLQAIDKYEPPYQVNFGSVACSRMKLVMSEDHNQTLIQIEQTKRRVRYRANKMKKHLRMNDEEVLQEDLSEIVNFVKESFQGEDSKSVTEIFAATTNILSIDGDQGKYLQSSEKYVSDDNIEQMLSDYDEQREVEIAINQISTLEKKALKLHFGNINFGGVG